MGGRSKFRVGPALTVLDFNLFSLDVKSFLLLLVIIDEQKLRYLKIYIILHENFMAIDR